MTYALFKANNIIIYTLCSLVGTLMVFVLNGHDNLWNIFVQNSWCEVIHKVLSSDKYSFVKSIQISFFIHV